MSTSQNGWPVVGADKVVDRTVLGADFPNGWLRGDVDVIFLDLIARLHHGVEPIMHPGCWGWFVKKIEGSTTISNHASGTAIDYNAPHHPMGVHNTYSVADQARIRIILRSYDGVIRWGGDYAGRPDDMHFEINKGAAAVKAVADRIRRISMPGVDLNDTQTNGDIIYSKGVNKGSTLTRYDVGTAPSFTVTPSAGNVYGLAGGVSTAQRDAAYARSLGEQNKLKLATLEATLNNCYALLQELTADSADTPNIIVDDVRYAIANPS